MSWITGKYPNNYTDTRIKGESHNTVIKPDYVELNFKTKKSNKIV